MTVFRIGTIERYVGLDADTKPSDVPIGSTFLEADDAVEFIFVGDVYHATGTLDMADAGDAADEFTVEDTTYVLAAADPGAGEVLVGASATLTATNIVAAINGTDGINTANPYVTAALSGADVVITAIEPGTAPNAYTTTYTASDDSANDFDAATLGGGIAAWQALP